MGSVYLKTSIFFALLISLVATARRADAITTFQLLEFNTGLKFQSGESNIFILEQAKTLSLDHLNRHPEISSNFRRVLESQIKKIDRFLEIQNELSKCNGDNKRGMIESALKGAGSFDHCEYFHNRQIKSFAAELSQVAGIQVFASELESQAQLDTKKSQESLRELRNQTLDAVKFQLRDKAHRINSKLAKVEEDLRSSLAMYKRKNPRSNALEWKKHLLSIGPTLSSYEGYLDEYQQQISDQLGRLVFIQPMKDKFGAPLEFEWSKFPTPLNTRNTISLPMHGSSNYKFLHMLLPTDSVKNNNAPTIRLRSHFPPRKSIYVRTAP